MYKISNAHDVNEATLASPRAGSYVTETGAKFDDLQQYRNWRRNMNTAMKSQVVLVLCLLSFVGARAAPAAETIGDGQEQARLLLSGRSFPLNETKSRSVASRSAASKSVPLDAQEQARQMILGGAVAKAFTAVGPSDDRMVEVNALELARRMILGTQAGTNSAKARLASRAE
jgi:hypothetical protein